MLHTMEFIREHTHYARLDDGSWRAEFRGRTIGASVAAPTLEKARFAILDALDDKLVEMLRDDVRGGLQPATGLSHSS